MSADRPHIVFTEPYDDQARERAARLGRVTQLKQCHPATLIQAVHDADALVIRTATRITRDVLGHAPRLTVIGRGGSGLDNIDLEAARERGITVVHTPDVATDAVADLTVGMILSLIRGICAGDRAIRQGRFNEARAANLGRELSSMTLGVIGMGRAGKAVARRCSHGFRMPVWFNDIVDVGPLDFPATPVTKSELYKKADIITLHVPLTDKTRSLIDATVLAECKPGACLINTSRGAVIDARAVADALHDGRLAGAAFDVFDPEPPPPDHPLLTAPNTLLTPHIGARTLTAQQRMNDVVEDVLRVLRNEPPLHPADEQATRQ